MAGSVAEMPRSWPQVGCKAGAARGSTVVPGQQILVVVFPLGKWNVEAAAQVAAVLTWKDHFARDLKPCLP